MATRIELTDLLVRITHALPDFPKGWAECVAARINLRQISGLCWRGAI